MYLLIYSILRIQAGVIIAIKECRDTKGVAGSPCLRGLQAILSRWELCNQHVCND